ncbi:hypothetical protein AB7M63_003630 [Bradyrhizobium japonicum]
MPDATTIATVTHSTYEVLKDFQPFGAALIALGAATLAYKSAMAKVEHDREVRASDRLESRLVLLLQLSAAAQRLKDEVDLVAAVDNPTLGTILLAIPDQIPEFEQASARLAMVPIVAINQMEEIRSALLRSFRVTKVIPGFGTLPFIDQIKGNDAAQQPIRNELLENCKYMSICSERLINELKPLIEKLRATNR